LRAGCSEPELCSISVILDVFAPPQDPMLPDLE